MNIIAPKEDEHQKLNCATCSCPSSSLTTMDNPAKNLHVDIHHGLFSGRHLSSSDPQNWYKLLLSNVKWHRVKYKSSRFQSDCETPCYTAFYGGRKEYKPYIPIPEWIEPLIEKVTTHLNSSSEVPVRFNAFLLRLYFDGEDEIAWHTDGRTFLGDEPTIASLSLGNKATFQLRRMNNVWPCVNGTNSTENCVDTETPIQSFVLQDGDLLVMRGKTQQYWHHRVPKEKGRGVRLNINFRYIMPGIDAERGQMTYYKYMVYGDVPTNCLPPSWTFNEIMKKKGGMMNFVKGGVKRKAAASACSDEKICNTSQEELKSTAAASSNNATSAALHSNQSVQVNEPTNNNLDLQQYFSSHKDVDPAVFTSLPIEIQNELESQWKTQKTQHHLKPKLKASDDEKKKEKSNSGKGTLDSFFTKK
jgi:alkylated DNA repair dioxygenase AlkB